MSNIYRFSTANNGYTNAPQRYVIRTLSVLSAYPAVVIIHVTKTTYDVAVQYLILNTVLVYYLEKSRHLMKYRIKYILKKQDHKVYTAFFVFTDVLFLNTVINRWK
jgi:hypothetical protein